MNRARTNILAMTAIVMASTAGPMSDAQAHTYYRTHCWRQAVNHHHWRYGFARRMNYAYARPAVYGYAPAASTWGYAAPAAATWGYAAPAAATWGSGAACGCPGAYGYGGNTGMFGGGGLLGLGLGFL
jgi:hypothetical protein